LHGITQRPTETRKRPNRQPRPRRLHPARPALADHKVGASVATSSRTV